MDESVISGANVFFPAQFGIDPGLMSIKGSGGGASRNQWLLGLVNSAPYVGLISYITDPTSPHRMFFSALLRLHILPSHFSSQSRSWTPRHYIRYRLHIICSLHMERCQQLLAASLCFTLVSRARNWSKQRNRADLRR